MNSYLPLDKQDIDNLPSYDSYEDYLWLKVERGELSPTEATKIIQKGEWHKVEDLMELDMLDVE